jgi:hypothetical protein
MIIDYDLINRIKKETVILQIHWVMRDAMINNQSDPDLQSNKLEP